VRRLALVLVVLATLAGAGASHAVASDAPSAADIESRLVCPTCRTTLDESDSPVARRMKTYIRTRLAQGASAKQIENELVAQFGPGVLSTPPTHGFDLLAWVLPIGGILIGAAVLGGLAWAWSRRAEVGAGSGVDDPPLDPELERRVDEELARFEG